MRLIFISGGVRSGKSAFAENYAEKLYENTRRTQLIYIASGVAFDEEMKHRIDRHKLDRKNSSFPWQTIEVIDDIPKNVEKFNAQSVVLWDCITTWTSNVLYKTEQLDKEHRLIQIQGYLNALKRQLEKWKKNDTIVLVVSNEILDEVSLEFQDVKIYRQILGELHQWIVKSSDEAYELDHGIFKKWK